jgi:hypothetical protein
VSGCSFCKSVVYGTRLCQGDFNPHLFVGH